MLNLVILRNEAGVTQKQLAKHLNISQGNLCDWEKGRSEPDIEKLIKIANYFDVSVDFLIGNSDSYGMIIAKDSDCMQIDFKKFKSLKLSDRQIIIDLINRLSQK